MIGSFITRGLLLIFGYACPAYECYKTVELNRPNVKELRFWCQYWILVAGLTVLERIGDTFISWVPMYGEAKVAFYIYLWFPKTKGAIYVYNSFFRPYIARHEPEIDRNLLKLRTRLGDMVVVNWTMAAAYGQTRVFDILQYIASQSSEAQPRNQGTRAKRPVPENRKSEEPSSHTSNSSSSEQQEGPAEQQRVVLPNSKPEASQQERQTTPTPSNSETSKVSGSSDDEQAMQIDSESPVVLEETPPSFIIQKEATQVTQIKPRQRRVNSGR